MKTYEKLEITISEFNTEDVILTSGDETGKPTVSGNGTEEDVDHIEIFGL